MEPPFRSLPGPLVIGALGGSGTRLIAQILIDCGFFLGRDLNRERDNLWFTLLFKRPAWYAEVAARDPGQLKLGFTILEKAMLGPARFGPEERAFVWKAARGMVRRGHDHLRRGRGYWPLLRAWRLLRSPGPQDGEYRGWGWKEPNSQFYIRPLSQHFKTLKFIYVMRHGLDMAYSGNQTQLHIWGHRFGLQAPERDLEHPETRALFWVEASREAIGLGRELLEDRFLALNFDRLCTHPDEVLPPLLAFAGLAPAEVDMERLRALPRIPPTMGRFRRRGLSAFSPGTLDAVRSLGFPVD